MVAYAQRLPMLVAKILATKFGFVPDCSVHPIWFQDPIVKQTLVMAQCNLGHQAITLTKDDHDKDQHAII